MTIQEAIQSGKPFKRHRWTEYWVLSEPYGEIFVKLGRKKKWYESENDLRYNPDIQDILAEDWEVKSDG